MIISLGFISAVQNVFPDLPSLNKLLFKDDIVAVQAFLQIAYKDFELTPSVVLSFTDTDSPDGVRALRERARKAWAIQQLLEEAAPLVREEQRRRRLEEECED